MCHVELLMMETPGEARAMTSPAEGGVAERSSKRKIWKNLERTHATTALNAQSLLSK
jgi:hypothetical protein